MVKFFKSLYLDQRLFIAIGIIVALFLLSFVFPAFFFIPQLLLVLLITVCLIDIMLLYRARNGINGSRVMADKLSNGDENEIQLFIENFYRFPIKVNAIDEIPHQFQVRDVNFEMQLPSLETKVIRYFLRPVKRGVYNFGALNVFVKSPIGLINRKFIFDHGKDIPVYPSYIQMRKYELIAFANRNAELGIKKIRRIGVSQEFEQIKEYVSGDDYRTVNWKATARKGDLMVNQFQDEKSQQLYCIIDKGRIMKSPFNKLSLLDYAINASLVISNIAIRKDDKAGLLTFSHQAGTFLKASKKAGQMQLMLETLYHQKTHYLETNYSLLYRQVRQRINRRSLLLLFTNFEGISSLKRQLSYLRLINKQHLLVVIFFENTELKSLLENPAKNLEEVYTKTIAEKFAYEKKQIILELKKHGIHSMLTAPENLTVNTINKYLELKSRGLL